MSTRNLERLAKARLLDPKKLSATHLKRVEKLTSSEVSTLIRVKSKLKFSGKLHRGRGKVEPDTFI
jgi:hypothetical protein